MTLQKLTAKRDTPEVSDGLHVEREEEPKNIVETVTDNVIVSGRRKRECC